MIINYTYVVKNILFFVLVGLNYSWTVAPSNAKYKQKQLKYENSALSTVAVATENSNN